MPGIIPAGSAVTRAIAGGAAVAAVWIV